MNTYLTQISGTIGKGEITQDLTAVAIKAWTALVQLLHSLYDNKHHANTLQAHKQVFQTVFKKIEKYSKEVRTQAP
jgi:hypothetical protein